MSKLSDVADRWPVLGPAVGNAVVQVALIWGLDLEPEVQAGVTGGGTILAALLSMLRAWKPASVAKETDAAFELGRAAGITQVLEIADREPPRPLATGGVGSEPGLYYMVGERP